jgi:CheY-like chemotaxis protein
MKKLKILIVENDEDEQEFIKEAFEESELFEVTAMAENGDALIDVIRANNSDCPDVILSDLNMHGKNGYDVLQWIKSNESYHHIHVVIMSTSLTDSVVKRCMDMGAHQYMIKPDTFKDYNKFAKEIYDSIIAVSSGGKTRKQG